ncbi:MAG TPA: YidC/Oxa1 family membrane protein insertase, partial [Candidatus Acidoferrum sp.]|nr:YidC/Oxa1 family membrane protein insertase [Candidatus Acidoferrum sp.]
RTKGNRQLESQLMMELYKERGVNPLGSIGLLLLQLPVLLTLYSVVRLITTSTGPNIAKYVYPALRNMSYVQQIIAHPSIFNDTLFGFVNLTRTAFGKEGVYIPVLLMALAAAALQYWQSRQLLPDVKEGRKLRDILKEQAAGKQVDQSEMSALMSRRMSYLFPFVTFIFSIYWAGALVLYLLTTSTVAVIQQRRVLHKDDEEMEAPATSAKAKLQGAVEAEVITPKTAKKGGKS